MLSLPPLSLYVHLPWCVRKCPYCDFNSHQLKGELEADAYVDMLLLDLELDLPMVWGRPVVSIFIGGGTPSLFSAGKIERLLRGVARLVPLRPDAEVTLEANPGTTEYDSFAAYTQAGVNRISLGVQSFDDHALERIGRIHGSHEVHAAIDALHRADLSNFNLDLMFGLPRQDLKAAKSDIDRAIEAEPAHISYYQLTLEPNTAFAHSPPVLPDDEQAWRMQDAAQSSLQQAGFEQYEISAWARLGNECTHNLNYWRYGDYLGIGAGAHAKITNPASGVINRIAKTRHPNAYMAGAGRKSFVAQREDVAVDQRVFEFFLNQLRLKDGVRQSDFSPRTGLDWAVVETRVSQATEKGLLEESGTGTNMILRPTDLGWRFVNETQELFLPADRLAAGPCIQPCA